MRAVFLALLVVLAPVAGVVGAATTSASGSGDVLAALGASSGSDTASASGSTGTSGTSGAASAASTANDSNASLGTSISSFMQASTAGAESEVDRAMFSTAFATANGDNRERLLERRVATLQKRLDRLEAEREALLEDGELTVAERAKAARLQARIIGLERAIQGVSAAADTAGIQVSGLDALRENASDLSGPEVAAIATGLGDDAPLRSGNGPGEQVDVPDAGSTNGSDSSGKSGEAPGQGREDGNGNDEPVEANVTNVTDTLEEPMPTPNVGPA